MLSEAISEHRSAIPIFLLAAGFIFFGIWQVRPHLMVVDAHWSVLWALKMGVDRTIFVPTFFKGGNLHLHLLTVAFIPVFLWLLATGQLGGDIRSMASGLSQEKPSIFALWDLPEPFLDIYYQFFVAGRIVSAILGLLTVVLVYSIGQAISSRQTGRYAALITALSFGFASVAHFATEDMTMVFFIVLTFYLFVRYHRYQTPLTLNAAAITTGLAISSKATSGLLILPLTYLHFSRDRELLSAFFNLVRNGGLVVTAYVLTTPSILVYPQLFFVDSIGREVGGYLYGQVTSGAAPLTHPGWIIQLLNLARGFGLPLFIVVMGGTIWAIRRWASSTDLSRYGSEDTNVFTTLLLIYVVPYFLIIGTWNTDAMFYVVPLIPLLSVLGGEFVTQTIAKARYRRLVLPVFLGALLFSTAYAGIGVAQFQEDSRLEARDWLERNVEPGSEIDVYSHRMNLPHLPADAEINWLRESNWSTRDRRIERAEPDYIVITSNQYEGCFQHTGTNRCRAFYRSLVGESRGYQVVETFGPSVRFEYSISRRLVDSVVPNALHPIDPTIIVLRRDA